MTQINGVLLTASQGTSGTQGTQGVQGTMGVQGVQGTTGSQGAQGVQGIQGIQGMSNILPLTSGKIVSSSFLSNTVTSNGQVANRLYVVPFMSAYDISYSGLTINVTTQVVSALAKIVIYDDNIGAPNNLLYASSDLDCSTLGQKIAITTGTFLAGVTYWLGFYGNSNPSITSQGSVALSAFRLSTVTPLSGYTRSTTPTYPTVPNPFGTVLPQTGNTPMIGIILT